MKNSDKTAKLVIAAHPKDKPETVPEQLDSGNLPVRNYWRDFPLSMIVPDLPKGWVLSL